MARTPELPRWALVRWPDAYDLTVPSCIHLDGVADALARGAILVAVEDEDVCAPVVFNKPRLIADSQGE